MRRRASFAAVAALSIHSVTALAQPSATGPVTVAASRLILPAGTRIAVASDDEINSTDHREGHVFRLTVTQDVRIGDVVVIPSGTRAMGEITWRSGRGGFGRSGKMNYSVRYIELGNRQVPVVGNFRQEGAGNTLMTSAAIGVAGPIAGALVTGNRARVEAGRALTVSLADATPFLLISDRAELEPGFRPRTVAEVMASEAELTRAAAETNCRANAPETTRRSARSLDQFVRRCIERAAEQWR